MNRLSWDEYFKEIVSVTKNRSPCERLKVGCILVKDKRISYLDAVILYAQENNIEVESVAKLVKMNSTIKCR